MLQENKLVVKKRVAEKKVREGRIQGVENFSDKKDNIQKLEAEDVEEFEDSDTFQFEQQLGCQSYEDDDVDEGTGKILKFNSTLCN